MRIASLLASATEIVCGLGLGDRLVAISHECDYPSEALDRPRVSRPRFDPYGLDSGAIDAALRESMVQHGSAYELDAERLQELAPDLILTQAVCEVCAVPTSLAQRASELLDHRPKVVSIDAHTIEDILASIAAVAQAAGVPERATELLAQLCDRIARVEAAVAGAPRPRVLALEWLDPPFVPGHWTPEMVALAGGVNLRGEAGKRSRQQGWEVLGGLDPDLLLIMPCGYDMAAARVDADRHGGLLVGVAGRAVDEGRAFLLDGSAYFNRSGPRMVDGIEILAALFHPDRFPGGDLTGRAEVWHPSTGR
jgi:iron complex transport system substrate-binding protein